MKGTSVMTKILPILLLALTACGRDVHYEYVVGTPGATGAQGEQGPTGPTGPQGIPGESAVIEVIDPCGDAPGKVDEVILRLADGRLLVLFAKNDKGDFPRLAIIGPGTYRTSDETNCIFTVTSDLRII